DAIAADLAAGLATLVVAHGNSLRALCMHLDGLTPQRVTSLHIPTGVPLRYDLDDALTPVVPGGVYLDPERAAAGIAEVAAQGSRRLVLGKEVRDPVRRAPCPRRGRGRSHDEHGQPEADD